MPRQNKKVALLIGADPELFVRDPKTGLFVSAHDKLPGTKHDPWPVNQGAVQVDGLAAEFNISPAADAKTFVDRCFGVMDCMKENWFNGFELVATPVAVFDKKYWDSLSDDTKEMGCNPDFNAYSDEENLPPDGGINPSLRTAAGHIHLGWTQNVDPFDRTHRDDCNNVAKQLDCVLGVASLMWDPDNRRRSLYGKAGAIRYKPYGVEYRVLSNVWLTSRELTKWVYDTTFWCFQELANGRDFHEEYGKKYDVEGTINAGVQWWKDKKIPDFLGMADHPFGRPPLPAKAKADPNHFAKANSLRTDWTILEEMDRVRA